MNKYLEKIASKRKGQLTVRTGQRPLSTSGSKKHQKQFINLGVKIKTATKHRAKNGK